MVGRGNRKKIRSDNIGLRHATMHDESNMHGIYYDTVRMLYYAMINNNVENSCTYLGLINLIVDIMYSN